MAKFGKWIGAGLGFAGGGPIGALLGFAVGSLFDTSTKTSAQKRSKYCRPSAIVGQMDWFE